MANELSITYNGQTKTKDSGVVLSTAGRVMVTDMTITAAADPHTLYTPNSTYFQTSTSGAVSAASIPQNNYPSATYYVKAATPAFDGGGVSGTVALNVSGTNTGLTTSNASGISVGVALNTITTSATRASVLYNGAIHGWVDKEDDAIALASGVISIATSKSNIAVTGTGTKYINNITIPSGKTLTIVSVNGTAEVGSSSTIVAGTVNINGGAINRGVQVKANKEAVVDGFTITYSTTATVNGVTFYAGDLKVPVWNSTNRNIEFPDPGVFSSAAGTTSLSIAGTITSINGLTIKDSGTTVTGSGTASAGTYDMYLAKWSTASSLTTGPHVTISSSTPSGGSNGDIWYQIL